MAAQDGKLVVERCRALLAGGSLHGALRQLNARTRHRCTGVYLFAPPLLRNVCLYDRENPAITRGGDTPMAETYCSIVAEGEPYATADAGAEPRLAQHPARLNVLAYCGVPIRDVAGSCIGTLCHFDFRPRLVPLGEFDVLHAVARIIPQYFSLRLDTVAAIIARSGTAVGDRIQVGADDEADQLLGGRRREQAH
jgi:hypothetical protein